MLCDEMLQTFHHTVEASGYVLFCCDLGLLPHGQKCQMTEQGAKMSQFGAQQETRLTVNYNSVGHVE